MAGVADTGGPMHGQPDVLIADEGCLARVDADPDPHLDAFRPGPLG